NLIARNVLTRPSNGGGRIWVEVLEAEQAAGRPIVVAGDGHGRTIAQSRDHATRLWPVADDITDTPNLVHATRRFRVPQHSVERFEVRVHIRHDGNSHRSS